MKKLIITLSASMLFFACKKDYTCECTTNPGNSVDKYTIKNVTKARAKANCVSRYWDENNVRYEENCSLK